MRATDIRVHILYNVCDRKHIQMDVPVEPESLSLLKDVIRPPSLINLSPALPNKVTTPNKTCCRDDFGVPTESAC